MLTEKILCLMAQRFRQNGGILPAYDLKEGSVSVS